MSKANNLTDYLTDLATSIKAKAGIASSTPLNAQDFSTTVDGLVILNGEERTETLTVNPTEYTPSSGKNAITKITVTAKDGSAQTPATTITASPVLGGYDGTTGKYKLSVASQTESITPTITEGWVSSGTAGVITIGSNDQSVNEIDMVQLSAAPGESSTTLEGDKYYELGDGYRSLARTKYFYVPEILNGEIRTVTQNDKQKTYTPTAPKNGIVSITVTVKDGSITAPGVNVATSLGSSTSTEIDSQYFTAKGTAGTVTAGWITSQDDGHEEEYKIKDGAINVTDLTITPNALTGSWDSTNNKYIVSQAGTTAIMQSASVTAGYISSTSGTKGTGTATVSAPSNLELSGASVTPSFSTNITNYFDETTGTEDAHIQGTWSGTQGWLNDTSGTGTYKKYKIKTGTITPSVDLPSGQTSSGTITPGKYIEIKTGWQASDKYYLADGTVAVYASNIDLGTSDNVPLVSTAGYTDVNYLMNVEVPSGKELSDLTNNGTVSQITNNATITTLDNTNTITTLNCSGSNGTIGTLNLESTGAGYAIGTLYSESEINKIQSYGAINSFENYSEVYFSKKQGQGGDAYMNGGQVMMNGYCAGVVIKDWSSPSTTTGTVYMMASSASSLYYNISGSTTSTFTVIPTTLTNITTVSSGMPKSIIVKNKSTSAVTLTAAASTAGSTTTISIPSGSIAIISIQNDGTNLQIVSSLIDPLKM